MRVGKWHIFGPKSHMSIASLVESLLAVAIEIWNHECGPFWPNFAVFAIVLKQVTTLPWHFTPKGALFGPIYGIYVG